MTTTHTPGPWIAKPLTYNWSIESEQGHPVARIPLRDVSLENLRLMKAAPDLLAQAQLAVTALQQAGVHPSYYAGLIEAIAKAGGAA